jgi:superfamily II DNA or RNA helicase
VPDPSTPAGGAASARAIAGPIAGFAQTAFPGSFRRYQELALEAFERARVAGDRRHYLTLPPGAGKTLIGLEIVRRLGRPTVVLAPNTAIVGQWLDLWSRFEPPTVEAADRTDLATPVSVLTYQALCVLDRDVPGGERDDGAEVDADEHDAAMADEAAADEAMAHEAVADRTGGDRPTEPEPSAAAIAPALTAAQRRRLIARGGDRAAVLGLLHANGRAIVDRLAALGPVTLVLDESHHLLELWGSLLTAILDTLHPDTAVVALTATPPVDLGPREKALHDQLFGTGADFEVVAPAVVKDGYLAPYQELALLVTPLADEARFIAEQGERFAALLRDVQDPDAGALPFTAWLDRRVVRRRSADGAPVAWATLERDDPALALAALRWYFDRGSAPPWGARYTEAHRRPPDAADWATLLGRWSTEALWPSDDRRDRAVLERLRQGLPAAGYRLTARGVVRGPSVVDRVLALSASKALGAASILSAESAVLGDRLRALILCDHESAGREVGVRLRDVLDPAAGSAALVLRTLLDGTAVAGLAPVMVTGRSVACSRATAEALVRAARALIHASASGERPRPGSAAARALDAATALAAWDLLAASAPASPTRTRPDGRVAAWDDLVLIDPPDGRWSARSWVPFLTGAFADGVCHVLIGTRALLGEGWDAPSVNVVIDLTTATTRAAVHQMRGRGMRLDPADPGKVADLWDIACIADDHPQGTADHARFARKHRHDLALNAAGEVESGVSHVDPSLTPWGPPAPPDRDALRARMLLRPAERASVRAAWKIGEPYRDIPVATVRVRTGRSPGLPAVDPFRHEPQGGAIGRARLRRGIGAAAILVALLTLAGSVLSGPLAALVGAGLGLLIAVGWLLLLMVGGLRFLRPADTLLDLGRAVADGLVGAGLAGPDAGAAAVRLVAQPDGWYRCLLEGVSIADAERFAKALDELMAPLWDPRWLIPRPVVEVQPTLVGAARFALQRLSGRLPGTPQVWHPVPDALAGRAEQVAAFQLAWRRWVAPHAAAVRARDPQGEAVLAARRGDDPFQTETQLRTLWT